MRRYEPRDSVEVARWLVARGHRPKLGNVPRIGLIEPGVAVGFLIQTDAGHCMLEGYATNPDAEKARRDSALNQITDELLLVARQLGYNSVIAVTKIKAIEERAREHGFVPVGVYKLLEREP